MSETTNAMEVSDSDTMPTASQESVLLKDSNDDESVKASTTLNEGKSTISIPPTNLAGLKQLIESNAGVGGGEMLMSLQTGVVTMALPNRSRSRSKYQRTRSKRAPASTVNPHERIKTEVESNTPKRIRETGGTPPSANQPSKKQHGKPANETVDTNTKPLSKAQKSRLKARMRKAQSLAKQQNAGNNTKINELVPPSAPGSKSSGSDNLIDVGAQQNAATSTSDAVQQHGPDPKVNMSYAQVADGHCMAIIDQRQPGQMQLLDQQRFNKINALLTDTIMGSVNSNTELPVFDDTRPHGGAMRVRCANAFTRKWLETNVPKLDAKKLWPGANLVVIDFKDIPKPHKFNVFFRGIFKSSQDIFRLLETQNKGITTKSWSVLHCGQRNGGTHMTIGVGQDSFDILRTRSNSLYCGMGKAVFTVIKSCKENKPKPQEATAEQTADANVAANKGDPSQMQQVQDQRTEHAADAVEHIDLTATQME